MKKKMDWKTIGQSKIVSQLKIGGEFILAGAEIGFGLAGAMLGLKTANRRLILAGALLTAAGIIRGFGPKTAKWQALGVSLEGVAIATASLGFYFGNFAVHNIGSLSPQFIEGAAGAAGFFRMDIGLTRFQKAKKLTAG